MIKLTLVNPLETKARPRFNRRTGKAYHDSNYKKWLQIISGKVKRLYDKSFPDFFCLIFVFNLKNHRKIDLDNLTGSICDCLVMAGSIPDDSVKFLKRYWVEGNPESEKESIEIHVCRNIGEYLKLLAKMYKKELEVCNYEIKCNCSANEKINKLTKVG